MKWNKMRKNKVKMENCCEQSSSKRDGKAQYIISAAFRDAPTTRWGSYELKLQLLGICFHGMNGLVRASDGNQTKLWREFCGHRRHKQKEQNRKKKNAKRKSQMFVRNGSECGMRVRPSIYHLCIIWIFGYKWISNDYLLYGHIIILSPIIIIIMIIMLCFCLECSQALRKTYTVYARIFTFKYRHIGWCTFLAFGGTCEPHRHIAHLWTEFPISCMNFKNGNNSRPDKKEYGCHRSLAAPLPPLPHWCHHKCSK